MVTSYRPLQGQRVFRRWLGAAFALPLAWGLGACALWQPTTVPLRQVLYPSPCSSEGAATRALLVMLPGRFMPLSDFERHGFVAAVRSRGIDADVLLVNAHLGYYRDRSVVQRLVDDVIEPARRRGVRDIWLVGISLGAFGSLLVAQARPGDVAGVVALGPYLGEPETALAIDAAGGLSAWQAAASAAAVADTGSRDAVVAQTWGWLQSQARQPLPAGVPPVYLGYGTADRFAPLHRLLAGALPAERTRTHPGGHDWPAWEPLWADWLDRLPLPRGRSCAAVPAVPG